MDLVTDYEGSNNVHYPALLRSFGWQASPCCAPYGMLRDRARHPNQWGGGF